MVARRTVVLRKLHNRRGLAALAACLMLGACAQAPKPGSAGALTLDDTPKQTTKSARSDLEKATAYWGQQYAKNPRDLDSALNYAMDLKALGEKKRALAVLQQASIFHGQSRKLAGEYGRLALEFDQMSVANRLLAAADDPANPDWRIISARGTVFAKQGKYQEAIPFYERALSLAHDQPSILSNLALAHAMNGEPARAESMLRKAAGTDPNSLKIRQNLALVLGLQGKYDEAKVLASRDLTMENAKENTNYLRRIVKLEPKNMPASAPEARTKIAQADAQTPQVTKDAEQAEGGSEPVQLTEAEQDAIAMAQWMPTTDTAEDN